MILQVMQFLTKMNNDNNCRRNHFFFTSFIIFQRLNFDTTFFNCSFEYFVRCL
nr:MAG TPA: hypothetical protein [Caudoviricetes sp.]